MNSRGRAEAHCGLTLVEAALALGLVALVLTAALASTATGLRAWLATGQAISLDRREANWNDQLRAAIAAMVPMEAVSGREPSGRTVFFQGQPNAMRFVTAHSPTQGGRGGVRLVELGAVRVGDGETHLVLTDSPCPDALRLGALLADPPDRIASFPPNLIGAGFDRCDFRYLRLDMNSRQAGQWVSEWVQIAAIPSAVRIICSEKPPSNGTRTVRQVVVTASVIGEARSLRNPIERL